MDDDRLRELLAQTRSIAVIGIKTGEHEDAFDVPRYLQNAGYRIIPVTPKHSEVLGERAFVTVCEISDPVDLINVFRAPAHIPAHVDEILAMPIRPRAVWLQLGIRHPEAAARLREAGIDVVEDRCVMVDHRRLLYETPRTLSEA